MVKDVSNLVFLFVLMCLPSVYKINNMIFLLLLWKTVFWSPILFTYIIWSVSSTTCLYSSWRYSMLSLWPNNLHLGHLCWLLELCFLLSDTFLCALLIIVEQNKIKMCCPACHPHRVASHKVGQFPGDQGQWLPEAPEPPRVWRSHHSCCACVWQGCGG